MKKQLLYIVFIILYNAVVAQPLQFTKITVKEGLNVNSVNDIIKDKKGFIWMATSDGICRYDGRNFKQYQFDKNKPNSLHSYIYTAIWEDFYGNIWLGGENGVEVIEAKTGNIKFIIKNDERASLYRNIYFCNIKSGKWVARVSYGEQIDFFDAKTLTLVKSEKIPELQKQTNKIVVNLPYYSYVKEDENSIYFLLSKANKIIKYSTLTSTFSSSDTKLSNSFSVVSNVHYMGKNTIRFLTVENKFIFLVEFDEATQTLNKKVLISPKVKEYQDNLASYYFYDSALKKSFIGIGGVGLYEYDESFKLLNIYKYDGQNPKSIGGNLFFSKCFSAYNYLWVINNPNGISYANLQKSTFTNYSSNIGLPDLSKGIFTDDKNNIYNIPVGNGIKYYNAQTGENITHTLPKKAQQQLNKIQYLAFNSTIPLGNNKVLLASTQNFVVYNYKTYSFNEYKPYLNKKLNIKNVLYYSQVCALNESNILMEYNKTLYHLTLKNDNTCIINDSTKFPELITAIQKINNGTIWVGTSNGTYIKTLGDEIKKLPETELTLAKHIIQATDNSIYIATLGGVFHYNIQGQLLDKFTTANGLSNNFCYTLIEDNLKNIWISNNVGLNKYNPFTNAFTNYTQNDGLQGNEFNSNAYCKDSSGSLYFGGINGITAFTPQNITESKKSFNPNIIAIAINDTWLNKDTAAWNIKQLQFPYNKNTISIEFAAMDLVNEVALSYLYKLEGYDNQWIDGGRNTVVRYKDLPAGRYSFLLKTKKNGEESKEVKLIDLTIKPVFYKTWWFYLLAILATIILMWQIVQAINKRKFQKKLQALKLQEELEIERQRISRDLHDNMGAYTSALIANVQQLKSTTGDNADLQKMQTNAEQILSSLRETIWVLNNKEITVQEFSDGFKNYCFKLLKNFEHISFDADENITNNFTLQASKAIHLNKIMQEVVQNIIKHANATDINYTLNTKDDLLIQITDNGKGFDINSKTNGYGLENIQWRAKEAGLDVSIHSKSGCNITIKNTLK
jgi:signal transduction histidine kinase